MENYLVELRLQERHDIPHIDKADINEISALLIGKIESGDAELTNLHEWHGLEVDNQCECPEVIDADETVFEIALSIDDDVLDIAEKDEVMRYVAKALRSRNAQLASCYSDEAGDKCRTTVHLILIAA